MHIRDGERRRGYQPNSYGCGRRRELHAVRIADSYTVAMTAPTDGRTGVHQSDYTECTPC